MAIRRKWKKVLLIICDQYRYKDIWPGDAGNKVRLPSYDRLCGNGIEFTQATTASAACSPARACLLSGKYSKETGTTSTSGFEVNLRNRQIPLGYKPTDPPCTLPVPPEDPDGAGVHNLASLLKGKSFATGDPFKCVWKGKWHLSGVEGNWPDSPPDGQPRRLDEFGFEGWTPPEGHGSTMLRLGVGADVSYLQESVQAIYDLRDDDRWLLVSSLINPHDIGMFSGWSPAIPDLGIDLPGNHQDKYLDQKPACQTSFAQVWGAQATVDGRFTDPAGWGDDSGEEPTPEQQQAIWTEYFQFYAHLKQLIDWQMSSLLDALEDSGQADDTLVVFTSDHGEMGSSHGMAQKWYQAYEETLRIPLVFHSPSLVSDEDGNTTDVAASSVDLVPTLLSLCGVDLPTGADELRGEDLSPILYGEADRLSGSGDLPDAALFVSDDDLLGTPGIPAVLRSMDLKPPPQPNHIRAIRTGGWKLVRYQSDADADDSNDETGFEYELYRTAENAYCPEGMSVPDDPFVAGELENLASKPGYEDIAQHLKARLRSLLKDKYDYPALAPSGD